jgi:signal transduction histidine kinase
VNGASPGSNDARVDAGRRRRLESHRAFLLLALFSVVVVAFGLFLNQQLLDGYGRTVPGGHASAGGLRLAQNVLAGLVAVLVGGALLYIRRLRRETEAAAQETDQYIEQLEATQKELRRARDDLEIRVAERTQEILRASESLRAESEERLRSIAQLERAHAVLDRQARRLAESNRDLQEFAYVASHDLQEPLRKILAFSDRLGSRLGDDLDDTARDYFERLRNAATRMQKLIDDLLVFSRVQTQGNTQQRADLAEIVRSVVGDLEIAIEESGTTVSVGDLPAIEADPSQMRQLFQNLIGNAMKFSKEGVAPMIAVAGGIEETADGPVCVITVADNGIGFEPEHAEKIFTVFQRLHGRGEYEGSGIGLAVTRRVAERHGGTIRATGRPGHGATFVIRIPAVQTHHEENTDDRAQRADALVG